MHASEEVGHVVPPVQQADVVDNENGRGLDVEHVMATQHPSSPSLVSSHENSLSMVKEPIEDPPAASQPKDKPYSVFTSKEKWIMVAMASIAGLFSPLTANVYLPAIPTISIAFHKSTELINLTVTVYMVMQAIAPMFWGTLADFWGRRPMFISCMLVLSLSCVGLALVPTNAYWLLLVLRCLQAFGSASTIALGAGMIADIATSAERGGYVGLYGLGPMIGPCIGPVIGGGLAQGLGWRSIFWFLCILSGVCLLAMILFLPETLRTLVGDGSIRPSPLYRPFIPLIGNQSKHNENDEKPPPKPFLNPLRIFLYPDITLILIFNGILYAVFYGIIASISTLFGRIYPQLSQTEIGLCFLSIGGGMVIGGVVTGKLLDMDYRRFKAQHEKTKQNGADAGEMEKRIDTGVRDESFPIEVARLRTTPVYFFLYAALCAGYGWSLRGSVSMAVPLILLFLMGWVTVATMNITQTLIVDLLPGQSATVTACNNLVRCILGAAMVSVVDIILNAVGVGWTYVILAAMCLSVGPIIYIEMHFGPRWRAKRRAREVANSK